jgi:hypothetical protein
VVLISCGQKSFLLSTWETLLKTTCVNKDCVMCSYKPSSQSAVIHRKCKSRAPPNKTTARSNRSPSSPSHHNRSSRIILQLPQGHKGPWHDIDQPAANSVIIASPGFWSDCLYGERQQQKMTCVNC